MNDQKNPNFDFYSFPTSVQSAPTDRREPLMPAVEPSAPVAAQEVDPVKEKKLRRLTRKSHSRVGWGYTLMILAWYLCSSALLLTAPDLLPAAWVDLFEIFAGTLPLYIIGVPVLCLTLIGLPRERVEVRRLKLSGSFSVLCMSLALMTAGAMIGNLVMSIAGTVSGVDYANALESLTSLPLWATVLLSCVLSPIFEELIFRKLLLERLLPFGARSAVVITSILFGLIHGNFYQFFYAALLGVLLGFLYLRTGKLRSCILLHSFVNVVGGVLSSLVTDLLDYDTFISLESTEQMIEHLLSHPAGAVGLLVYELLMYGLGLAGLIMLFVHLKKVRPLLARRSLEPTGKATSSKLLNFGMIAALLLGATLFAAYFASYLVA